MAQQNLNSYSSNELIKEKKIYKRRRKLKKRKSKGYLFSVGNKNSVVKLRPPIYAPVDFRFSKNSVECLYFFNSLRSKENYSNIKGQIIFRMSLRRVKQIDFATISILKSIIEESKYYGILFTGNLPKDELCAEKLVESGFLNKMYDKNSQEINIPAKGTHFTFEKQRGKLTDSDIDYLIQISEQSYKFITGTDGFFDEVITILKEIAGNAFEWSNSYNNQWMIGVYMKDNEVIINVTDLGKGILETLYVNNRLKFIDLLYLRNDKDVLERAFQRKYGSLSQEINRNQGLPSIKNVFDEKKIDNLLVCSNTVLLDFSNDKKSKLFRNLSFSGTFYQWELNHACINNE